MYRYNYYCWHRCRFGLLLHLLLQNWCRCFYSRVPIKKKVSKSLKDLWNLRILKRLNSANTHFVYSQFSVATKWRASLGKNLKSKIVMIDGLAHDLILIVLSHFSPLLSTPESSISILIGCHILPNRWNLPFAWLLKSLRLLCFFCPVPSHHIFD